VFLLSLRLRQAKKVPLIGRENANEGIATTTTMRQCFAIYEDAEITQMPGISV
jgi:hypothetical protein